MFDAGDQFQHLIASSRSSLPMSSFPLPSFSAAAFDHLYSSPSSLQTNTDQTLQQFHVKINNNNCEEKGRSKDPSWSNDEVLALLKIRSTMENWFPDFSWEHVSRKLAEVGFRRRAEECKEKFEQESERVNVTYNNKYRINFSELDEFYPNATTHQQEEPHGEMEKQNEESQNKENQESAAAALTPNPVHDQEMSEEVVKKSTNKKRKRKDKFEIFKGFVEVIVKEMMSKQEELHNKLIEDLLKRDEDKIAREEARKNSDMERIKLEVEKRAQEQAGAGERQSIIIDFLNKFTTSHQQDHITNVKLQLNNLQNSSTSLCEVLQTTTTTQDKLQVETSTSNNSTLAHQNPNSKSHKTPSSKEASVKKKSSTSVESSKDYDEKGSDIGMRWPRDQVLALINLRCKLSNSSESVKEGAKGPLWERISQGMLELGYKRSAKRCKEKWENINKYFRKTKDSNKKRSIDSRTCPYFHQLNSLYTDGTLVAPSPTDHVPDTQL